MKRAKTFDCVAMKDAIQRQLAATYAELTPMERWKSVEEWLATSDDAVARKWRSLPDVQSSARRYSATDRGA